MLIPNWLSKTKKVDNESCRLLYKDTLDNKLGILSFLSFEECRKEVRKYKFKSIKKYQKNRKPNWPSNPAVIYKDKYIDSYDFLGKYLSFEEFKKEVKKYKFKSIKEYQKNRKPNWPSEPSETYKNKGWKGWYDFLGKKPRQFLSFEECRKEVRKLNITTHAEYQKNRRPNWPSVPERSYDEFTNYYDFFGKKEVKFLSFEECRKEVRKLKIKNALDYKKNRKLNWPSAPRDTYKKTWKGWDDFLGK